ncbi:MAG: hypothetical protein Q4C65_05150 [Eubacteriales bacterium]|nr:hypothetical protein [Eubacteriales bacterium]
MSGVWIILIVIYSVVMISRAKSRAGGSGKKPGAAGGASVRDNAGKRNDAAKSVPDRAAQARQQTPLRQQAQHSVTDYLRQKASADEAAHAAADRMDEARLSRETGGRTVGRRYSSWDSVPKGMRVVKCGYCGAENLIPEGARRKNCTCYFCREIL